MYRVHTAMNRRKEGSLVNVCLTLRTTLLTRWWLMAD